MNHRAVLSIAVVLSGAVAYESLHDGLPHADYNVPATVQVLDSAPQSNVAQAMIATTGYQTVAVTGFLEVKG
ncbi:MAG: hypothetical protein WA718_15470 [Terriglobales bacterium]